MKRQRNGPWTKYLLALGVSTGVSLLLYAYAALRNDSLAYGYLPWNLLLSWIPLAIAIRLSVVLRKKLWSSWEAMLTSALWLIFLPNSFYMITDYVHLQDVIAFNCFMTPAWFPPLSLTGVFWGFIALV